VPTPKVSVVIPIYNCENYLPETVGSVLSQNYPNLELILINDGSPGPIEKTVQKLSRLYPGKFTFINKKENEGIAPTVNRALRQVNGKYFSILGGDDLYLKNRVRVMVDYLENHPEAGLAWSNGYLLSGNLKTKKLLVGETEKKKNESSHLYHEMLMGNFVLAPSIMHRTDLVRKLGGFNEKISHMEDWDLGLRIAKNHHFGYVDQPLVYYRVHPGNISKKYDVWLKTLLQTIEERKKHDHFPAHYYSEAVAKINYNYGYLLAKQGLIGKSLGRYFRAIKSSPTDVSLYLAFPELLKQYLGGDRAKRT
jgi:glycosyltransferase involved in cell wall biosynthesis